VRYQDCLSLMELLEIKNAGGAADAESRAHLEHCDRCGALLAQLESDELARVEVPERLPLLTSARGEIARPEQATAGQLWLAMSPASPKWRYPVVVIGRPRQRPGTVLVAPLVEEIDEATDLDVLVGGGPLGYPAAAAIWAYGTIFEHQLAEYIADLGIELLEEIRGLYRYVAGADERPAPAHVGPALGGPDDPRRLFRQELQGRLRPLYEPVRSAEVGEPPALETTVAGETPTFGVLLDSILGGVEWDRQALLERADLSAERLDMILGDWLDLTHRRDIEPLARTLKTLELDPAEVEAPILRSLRHSRGGELRPGTSELSVAARASTGAAEEEVERDLYRGLEDIDESPAARDRAAATYWKALLEKLGEL
jgi:hypothetical protein